MVLAGVITSSESGSLAPPRAMTVPQAASSPKIASVSTVNVREETLVGRPVAAAARQLRQLGLTVHVVWETSGGQAAGTVLDVRPAGRRPVGSLVTLVGAFRRAGHRDPAGRGTPPGQDPGPGPGHGAGNGNGNGQGIGNGNGQGHGKSDGTGPDNGNSRTLADS